jgi:hypothetical protein
LAVFLTIKIVWPLSEGGGFFMGSTCLKGHRADTKSIAVAAFFCKLANGHAAFWAKGLSMQSRSTGFGRIIFTKTS